MQFLEAIAGGKEGNEFIGIKYTGVWASLLALDSFTLC